MAQLEETTLDDFDVISRAVVVDYVVDAKVEMIEEPHTSQEFDSVSSIVRHGYDGVDNMDNEKLKTLAMELGVLDPLIEQGAVAIRQDGDPYCVWQAKRFSERGAGHGSPSKEVRLECMHCDRAVTVEEDDEVPFYKCKGA